ncbi:MAG: type II toxin-antitoxin system VapC family toxin [Acidobacteria bacterium]|nr:type II toxin-antitoxin system VapC family toxin [Acidobacteriota bacterium]
MTSSLVIDASVTLSWCFPGEATPVSQAVLDALEAGAEAVVPCLWLLEVTNTLVAAERRGRITNALAEEFLADLRELSLTVDPPDVARTFENIRQLARTHNLTAYDAAYLELAIRKGIPLVTLDTDLKRAAVSSAVEIFQP